MHLQLGEPSQASELLMPLYKQLEPLDERQALRVCLLLLDCWIMLGRNPDAESKDTMPLLPPLILLMLLMLLLLLLPFVLLLLLLIPLLLMPLLLLLLLLLPFVLLLLLLMPLLLLLLQQQQLRSPPSIHSDPAPPPSQHTSLRMHSQG